MKALASTGSFPATRRLGHHGRQRRIARAHHQVRQHGGHKLSPRRFFPAQPGVDRKQQTVFGPINSPSLANAPFEGAQKVLSVYAERIYDAIKKDGFYVRVPSGKQFYLYVLQTIDRADAAVGGSAKTFAEEDKSALVVRAASLSPNHHQHPVPAMKYLALIPLVFVSCASRPQLVVRPRRPPPSSRSRAVRYSEVVRAYYIGRFVDPNHPDTMNEQHPVYRIESSARWNLHPGSANTVNLLNPPPDAAFAPPPTNDAVISPK